MDRRSWPWKKKSCDKTGSATDTKVASLPNSSDNQAELYTDDSKIVNYVQVPVESYAQLTELEGQVKDLNAKVSDLNDKLSSAQSELSDLNDKLSSAQSELSDLNDELSLAQSELSSTQSELSSAQSEMTTKENLVKQHAKVAVDAVSGWEKAESESLALKHQLESVMLLKLTAEHRVSQLEDALKECMKQMRNVKEESEQELRDVVFAKTKQWENAKAELEARLVEFEQELLRASADNAALSRSLQERSHLLMRISEEKCQVDAEIELMKNDIQTCEGEISSLKYELRVVSKELEIRSEEKNMSARSAEAANRQHVEDVKKMSRLEAECQRLRGLVRKRLPGPAALAQMKLEVENLGRDCGDSKRRSPSKCSSPRALENMQQCHKENEFLAARLLTMEEETKTLKEALSARNSELQASRDVCAKTTSKLRSIEAHVLVTNQQKVPAKSIAAISTSISEDGMNSDNSNQLLLMDDFLEMEKLAYSSSEATVSTEIQNNVGGDEHFVSEKNDLPVSNIQLKIARLFESRTRDNDMRRLLEDIRQIVQDSLEELPQHSADCMEKECHEDVASVTVNSSKPNADRVVDQEVKEAISWILRFVSSIGKGTEGFSASVNEENLDDFIVALSRILIDNWNERESYSPDCVDKLALLENKVDEDAKERLSDSPSYSNPEIEGPLAVGFEPKATLQNFQQLKLELARCRENLELTKLQLAETQNSNCLAETQLKCMAESYKSLESRKEELENQVTVLVNELHEEKHSHRDDLAKYKELQEKIERNSNCSSCSVRSEADMGTKTIQEREIVAAAEKLAECQETIFLLSKHLNALRKE